MTKNDKMPLINGVLFTVLGFVIFFNSDSIITFASYFLGGLLMGIGLYKVISYNVQNKKTGIVNQNELYFGLCALVFGLVIILLGSVVELLFKLTLALWLIISGVFKILSSFNMTEKNNRFFGIIVIGLIFIAAGIYTLLVANIGVQLLGIFMIIYGIIDFISYFILKNNVSTLSLPNIKEAEIEEKE